MTLVADRLLIVRQPVPAARAAGRIVVGPVVAGGHPPRGDAARAVTGR